MKSVLALTLILFSGSLFAAHPKAIKAPCQRQADPIIAVGDDVDKKVFEKIKSGKITATMRAGMRCFKNGAKEFKLIRWHKDKAKRTSFGRAVLVEEPYYIKFKDISKDEASAVNAAGFLGVKDQLLAAKTQFKHYYKKTGSDSVLTVIRFKYIGE